ncbi:MAG: hypothetical protein ABWX92_05950 [Mycetocola sp.]
MTTTLPTTYTLPMQQDVALFHDSFGMPNLIATPGPLPLDRIELRIGLIREEGVVELREAIEANDIVAIVDALVDTVYVALGALVEMGVDALEITVRPEMNAVTEQLALLAGNGNFQWCRVANEVHLRELEDAFLAADKEKARYFLSVIAEDALQTLTRSGIDPQPFFDEVQRANMSKLGADGKPVHSRGMELDGYPKGKVLKGANYSPPDLAAIYARLYGDAPSVDATATDSDELARGVRPTA